VWERLDPTAQGKIDVADLPLLLANVSVPLGVKHRVSQKVEISGLDGSERLLRQQKAAALPSVLEVIKELDIPIRRNHCIAYVDTFAACAARVSVVAKEAVKDLYKATADEDVEGVTGSVISWTRSRLAGISFNKARDKYTHFITDQRGEPYTAACEYAARRVQEAYREYRVNWSRVQDLGIEELGNLLTSRRNSGWGGKETHEGSSPAIPHGNSNMGPRGSCGDISGNG